MADITHRPDRRKPYLIRWYDLDGVRRSRSVSTKRDARRLSAQIEASKGLGVDWKPQGFRGVPSLDEACREFLTDRARLLKPRTVMRYSDALGLLLKFVEEKDPRRRWTVKHLTRPLMADGWGWLMDPKTSRHNRGRTVPTGRKLIQVWTLLWKWAYDHDQHGAHTVRPRVLELPKMYPPVSVAPTWGDVDAMLAALCETAPDWGIRLGWLVRYTGARRGALLRLTWDRVDLEARRIVLSSETTKGGYGGRSIPIHQHLVQLMAGWGIREGRVVGAPELELTGRGHVDRTFRRAWKRAGVRPERYKGRPIHGLRHCLRTHLVHHRIAIDVIDAILGHAGSSTGSRHYTDRAALWPDIVAAVATIPTHGEPIRARHLVQL